jgi:hypothetical protein
MVIFHSYVSLPEGTQYLNLAMRAASQKATFLHVLDVSFVYKRVDPFLLENLVQPLF